MTVEELGEGLGVQRVYLCVRRLALSVLYSLCVRVCVCKVCGKKEELKVSFLGCGIFHADDFLPWDDFFWINYIHYRCLAENNC